MADDLPPCTSPAPLLSTVSSTSTKLIETNDAAAPENESPTTFPEYPNGNMTIQLVAHDCDDYRTTGWAVVQTHKWKITSFADGRAFSYRCLGVMVCPVAECNYVLRPKRESKLRDAQLTSKTCTKHDTHLEHLLCQATITWKQFTTAALQHVMTHHGTHFHPRPPPIRPPPSVMNKFRNHVLTAPSVMPKQLAVGSLYNTPVTSLHPSLQHLDRVGYLRRRMLQDARTTAGLNDVVEWQGKHPGFIAHMNLVVNEGCIIMQTQTQKELCQSFVGCLQTDALESFVKSPDNGVLCITSGYSEIVGRTIPLLYSLLLGKTEQHYCQHFRHLFKSLSMKLQPENDKSGPSLLWSCMVMDFSVAQLNAFYSEFKLAIIASNPEIPDVASSDLANSYIRGCQIHYFRSLVRVSKIGAVVPKDKSAEFIQLATELVNCEQDRFNVIIDEMVSTYPNTSKWLHWYLAPSRANLIFKCYSGLGEKWFSADKNTNAQEGTGKDVKFSAVASKLSLFEVIDHLWHYTNHLEQEINHVLSGQPIRYKRKKPQASRARKRITTNDGRAPDTSTQLIPTTSPSPYSLAFQSNMPQHPQTAFPNIQTDGPISSTRDDGALTHERESLPASAQPLLDAMDARDAIPFLLNRDSSCYADSLLFICYNIFKISYVAEFIKKYLSNITIPPNFLVLREVLALIDKNDMTAAQDTMLNYIWKLKKGTRGKHQTFTTLHHVFLEPTNSQSIFFQPLTGITYIKHIYCSKCGYYNELLYNSTLCIFKSSLAELDPSSDITIENYLNYRHTHESKISICTGRRKRGKTSKCGGQREMWYSILNIGAMFVISLEDYREICPPTAETKPLKLQSRMDVSSLTGNIRLSLFGLIHHLPGHWVCRSLLGSSFQPHLGISNAAYYYDDIVGKATPDRIDEKSLDDTVSGFVYVKSSVVVHELQFPIGTDVNIWFGNSSVMQATVVGSTGDHVLVKITRAMEPDHEVLQFKRACSIYAKDSIGCYAVFKNDQLSPAYKPVDSNSDAASEFDLTVQRVMSKTRRNAK